MENDSRPRRSVFDWVLELVSLTTLFVLFAILAAHWKDLPSKVPEHFDDSGNPDGWGGKNALLLLPLVATGLYAMLTAISRYQNLVNLPFRVNRNTPEVKSLLLRLSIILKAIMLFIFLYLTWGSVSIATGSSTSLREGILFVGPAAILLVLSFYLIKLRRYREF